MCPERTRLDKDWLLGRFFTFDLNDFELVLQLEHLLLQPKNLVFVRLQFLGALPQFFFFALEL